MDRPTHQALEVLLVIYAAASFIHFVHNAEFLAEYPGMPATWSRADIYIAWVGMTIVGVVGWLVFARGRHFIGLFLLAVYASLGLDSLGHYVLAPPTAHTFTMNWTILLEVSAAALVFLEVGRLVLSKLLKRKTSASG